MTGWRHSQPGKPSRRARVLGALAAAESVLLVIGGLAFASGLDRAGPVWRGYLIAILLIAQAVLMFQLGTRLTSAEVSISWWRQLWTGQREGANAAQLEQWHRLAEDPYRSPNRG